MKTFETFYDRFVILSWCILILIHGLSSLSTDYSAPNDLVISFIILGFVQNQIMIKLEIQKLKEKK